jgi:NTE family protein
MAAPLGANARGNGRRDPRPRRAVVLSGGGARGAYEAGVLAFLLRELEPRIGRPTRLDVLCGTSVGALHACWLAATAGEEGRERAAQLQALWTGMRADALLRLGSGRLIGWSRRLAGVWRTPPGEAGVPAFLPPASGLFDRGPFEALVRRAIPWPRIAQNLAEGRFEALSVTATDVASGHAVVFLESRDGLPRHWTPDPTIVARAASIGPGHALASAAIPVVFPAVALDGRQYVDGSLRLNTPLVPALRFGAERMLVVALQAPLPPPDAGAASAPAFDRVALLGKVLSAMLLDPIDADLGRMRFVNDVLRRGERTFGPEFLAKLNATAVRDGAQPLALVDEAVIRPSADPRLLAADAMRALRARGSVPPILRLLDRSFARAGRADADLLSYVLFDGAYTSALFQLGLEDARKSEESLARFFAD